MATTIGAPPSRPRALAAARVRRFGGTARRLAFAIFVTALIPALSTLALAREVIARVSATAFVPEFGAHLDQALGVYADLAKAVKQGMRSQAETIASSSELAAAVRAGDAKDVGALLGAVGKGGRGIASLAVEGCTGEPLGRYERAGAPQGERLFTVRRPISAAGCVGGDAVLVATFATPSARFDELESANAFAQAYHQIEKEHREDYLDRTYVNVFLVVVIGTIGVATLAGALLARPTGRRLAVLAAATRPVAAGDLSVRVAVTGDDEIADLGRAFNAMLEELARSRTRSDFLQRVAEWQKIGRRLAHEIKNPLTPIQLAVEECHRRYSGDDAAYRRILDTTAEIVGEEIASLRRLVGEFSEFARLPRAALHEDDLAAFLRDQDKRLGRPSGDGDEHDRGALGRVEVVFDVPDAPAPAVFDREMLHRVIGNVVRNAAQAIVASRGDSANAGRIEVRLHAREHEYEVIIDDDGPGIRADVAESLFDPYVTTKNDGTGLGLSIVKKIVVDHGGSIDASSGPLGGARIRVVLPKPGTPAALAALEQSRAPVDEHVA